MLFGLQLAHGKPSRYTVNNTSLSAGRLHYFFLLLLTRHFTNSILCLIWAQVEEVFCFILVSGLLVAKPLFHLNVETKLLRSTGRSTDLVLHCMFVVCVRPNAIIIFK